jgi:uncharacterized protein (DUF4415 family)
MAKKKISYAKKSTLDADEFDSKHVKVLISIRLSADVLAFYKKLAHEKGVGYQALIQQALSEKMKDGPLSERIEKIERKIPILERALLKTG